jgi:hypothetical protein
MDVLQESGPVGAIVVMDGAQVLGVVGPDELRAATRDGDRESIGV